MAALIGCVSWQRWLVCHVVPRKDNGPLVPCSVEMIEPRCIFTVQYNGIDILPPSSAFFSFRHDRTQVWSTDHWKTHYLVPSNRPMGIRIALDKSGHLSPGGNPALAS